MTQTQITLTKLNKMKQHGEKIAMLTAYDATFARLQYEAGVDVVLVGDSLGMVLQGCASTLPVTVEDMVYHVGCVARGAPQAFIMADMPFMSGVLLSDTVANARKLMQAGAHMVKLEGGLWLGELIQTLSRGGIPVCAHLGLTPQSVNQLGGYKVQGKDPRQAEALISCAKSLEAQGAAMLLLECVPADLARRISQSVQLPVIGIGAGVDCDGQVLVMHDMLGANPHPARFVQNFLEQQNSLSGAFQAYVRAVKSKTFPAPEQSYFF